MTRDIGRMDTPPYGTSIYPNIEVTPVETPSRLFRQVEPQVAKTLDDIYVLGKWFARPRNWSRRVSTYYFCTGQENYLRIAGGIDLNNRFMVPFRQVAAGRRVHLHDFHSIIGRLGACFRFPDNARSFSKNFDAWHDVTLKSFFLEMLRTSHPTAGETLVKLWKYNMDNFTKAISILRNISTSSQADDYSRSAALRVFGYTAPFFSQCHDTYRHDALDHLSYLRTHDHPLIASSAMISLRALGGIAL